MGTNGLRSSEYGTEVNDLQVKDKGLSGTGKTDHALWNKV